VFMTLPSLIKQAGYTLLELSIVLAILGLLVAGGLTLYQNRSEAIRVEETRDRLMVIDQALKDFFARNEFLPCPADGRLSDNAASFGVSNNLLSYNPLTRECAPPQGGGNLRGMVPVRTLGLDDTVAYDGWGRRFSYQLSSGMGDPEHFRDEENTTGDIQVFNPEGLRMTHPNYRAAYVVLSHGANGFYAWRRGGAANYITPAAPADAGVEIYNEDGTDLEFMLGEIARDFDDIGLYRTKMEVYQPRRYARRIELRNTSCTTARTLVNQNNAQVTAALADYATATSAARADTLVRIARLADELCRYGYRLTEPKCAPNMLWLAPDGYQSNAVMIDTRSHADCWCPGDETDGRQISLQMDYRDTDFGQCEK